MSRNEPYVCPTCREVPDGYFGRLVFPEELPHPAEYWEAIAAGGGQATPDPAPPLCPHHPKVQLIPARQRKTPPSPVEAGSRYTRLTPVRCPTSP